MNIARGNPGQPLKLGVVILLLLVSVFCGCADDFVPARIKSGTFYIGSQADLNALSGVQSILGTLLIEKRLETDESDPVVDLSPLSDLESVTGSLRIDDIDTIDSLGPLASLRSVGSNLYLGHLDSVRTLIPLQKLNNVGLVLFVQDNDRLKDLDGLQSINFENGADLHVALNDSLVGLHGLENIRAVSGRTSQRFTFNSNDQLSTLSGLDNLRLARALEFRSNPLLSDISALGSLRVVRELVISDCERLTDISVISNVDTCTTLRLVATPISSLSMLAGVEVNDLTLSGLPVADLSTLGDRSSLFKLHLHEMPHIVDFRGLESLYQVEYLIVEGNPRISSLTGLSMLETVKYVRFMNNLELCNSTVELWIESIVVEDEAVVQGNGGC